MFIYFFFKYINITINNFLFSSIIRIPKYLLFNIINKYCDDYIDIIVNIFKYKDGSFLKKIDLILSSLILKLEKDTKNINCSILFFFLFLFLYDINIIYYYLAFLFFSVGVLIKLVRFSVKWINLKKFLDPNIYLVIKYLLFGLIFINLIIVIVLLQKIFFLIKVYAFNILNTLKDLKLNIDYKLRKGNKSPKKPEFSVNFFSDSKKKKKKEAFSLKERVLEVQKNKTIVDYSNTTTTRKFSIKETRNWTNRIEMPKRSEFTVESQIQNINYEYEAYNNQEKKFKKIVIDIDNNKENFFPKESKSLFKEYVEVVKILKKNLKDIKKDLKNRK